MILDLFTTATAKHVKRLSYDFKKSGRWWNSLNYWNEFIWKTADKITPPPQAFIFGSWQLFLIAGNRNLSLPTIIIIFIIVPSSLNVCFIAVFRWLMFTVSREQYFHLFKKIKRMGFLSAVLVVFIHCWCPVFNTGFEFSLKFSIIKFENCVYALPFVGLC